jgi:hypothetical protein
MNEERITDLFGRLQELPSEVPFGEVEHWARLHAAGQLLPQAPHIGAPGKLPWYSFKPPLYMTSIITAAAASGLAALIAVSTTDENPVPQPAANPVAITDSVSIMPMPADTPVIAVQVKPSPNGDTTRREFTINAPANARITVSASDETASSVVTIDENGVNALEGGDSEYAYEYDYDTNDGASVASGNENENEADQCVCGKNDDAVQRDFVKQLLADGIISSDKNYSFYLDKKKFTVNGKRQSDEIHDKYLRLYVKLNGGSLSGSFSWQVQVSSD